MLMKFIQYLVVIITVRNKMNKFVNSKQYILFMIVVIMPLNGMIIVSNNVFLGLFLLISQIPFIYKIVNKIDFNER